MENKSITLPSTSASKSYWLESLPASAQNVRHTRTSPTLPRHADVVVIGAGMTGVSCAYHLAQLEKLKPSEEKKSILLLEARGLSGGATGRNGGDLRLQ